MKKYLMISLLVFLLPNSFLLASGSLGPREVFSKLNSLPPFKGTASIKEKVSRSVVSQPGLTRQRKKDRGIKIKESIDRYFFVLFDEELAHLSKIFGMEKIFSGEKRGKSISLCSVEEKQLRELATRSGYISRLEGKYPFVYRMTVVPCDSFRWYHRIDYPLYALVIYTNQSTYDSLKEYMAF